MKTKKKISVTIDEGVYEAALSTTIRSYPMNVLLEPPEGGLTKPSIVKTSQILTVSKERLEKKLGAITPEKMQEVNQALHLSLAL